jgi:RNA polymerase subunit RPABC4/transcription elongation factor Spt4
METSDKFPLAPENAKKSILKILDNLNVIQMYNLLDYLNDIKDLKVISNDISCGSCFTEIPKKHFERRINHDNEHCPNCGNDLFGNRWYNGMISKEASILIKNALRNYLIK